MKNWVLKKIAVVLDILHIPLAIAILLFGHVWMSPIAHAVTMIVVVFLQVLCLGCPLSVFTAWLHKQCDPDYTYRGGFTLTLYERYGPLVAIPIFFASIAASYGTAMIMLP